MLRSQLVSILRYFFFSFLPTLFLARVQNDYQKTITGVDVSLNIKMWIYYSNLLQLFSVGSDNNPKYVQNIWAGQYQLGTQATLTDTIPANVTAGVYYFR